MTVWDNVQFGMIYGIGTDIVEIDRIRDSLNRFGESFVQRLLSDTERREYQASRRPERFIAKRFAAKEATVKALGLGFRQGLAFNLIEVTHDCYGKPGLAYRGRALERIQEIGIGQSLLSISDERDYAVAFAVLVLDPRGLASPPTGALNQ